MLEAKPSVERLSRDLAKAAGTLSQDEARFLVDAYYVMQANRMRSNNQVRALSESREPHSVLNWLAEQDSVLEKQIARALDKYSAAQPLGEWARSVVGIGPVIAAGLLAHIDMEKAPTVGHIWRFAGLDPTQRWGKGQKRPHNAALKVLCWKIGESFVKVKSHEEDVYGKVYERRKAYEHARNARGEYADQAAAVLVRKPDHAQKAIYMTGKLPDGHLHVRAQRYATKLFLAHYHEHGCRLVLGTEPPKPYPIAHLDHVHWDVAGVSAKANKHGGWR